MIASPDMTLRFWSIACFVAAVVGPAFVLVRLDQYIEANYHLRGLVIEGKAVASTFLTLIPLSWLLSLVGLSLGTVAYRRLSKPRPLMRKLELAMLAMVGPMWLICALPLFVWVRD